MYAIIRSLTIKLSYRVFPEDWVWSRLLWFYGFLLSPDGHKCHVSKNSNHFIKKKYNGNINFNITTTNYMHTDIIINCIAVPNDFNVYFLLFLTHAWNGFSFDTLGIGRERIWLYICTNVLYFFNKRSTNWTFYFLLYNTHIFNFWFTFCNHFCSVSFIWLRIL